MAVLFPTDLQRQQPSDEQVVLAAGNDNIAHNMRVGDLVNYVRENVPLETLIETNSSQQQTIETMAQTAEGKDATIAQLTANQAAPALESELAAGKTDLATAITAKGVETAATDSLATMADKVREIVQETTTISGGEFYPQNMLGTAIWNLFDVAAMVKSQYISSGRYAGAIVAQYYKGYATLDLTLYGGGYAACLTSDGDFYANDGEHTPIGVHTWHDDDSGKADRYVVFLWIEDNYTFQTLSSGVCPRQIVVLGTCDSIQVNYNRLMQLYAPAEFGELKNFRLAGSNTPEGNWAAIQIWQNYKEHTTGTIFQNANSLIYVEFTNLERLSGGYIISGGNNTNVLLNLNYISFPSLKEIVGGTLVGNFQYGSIGSLIGVLVPNLKKVSGGYVLQGVCNAYNGIQNVRDINFPSLEEVSGGTVWSMTFINANDGCNHLKTIGFPALTTFTGGTLIYAKSDNSYVYNAFEGLDFPRLRIARGVIISDNGNYDKTKWDKFTYLKFGAIEEMTSGRIVGTFRKLEYIYVGYTDNDRTLTVNLNGATAPLLTDIELKDGYCKNLTCSSYTALTAENIVAHILNRLGVNQAYLDEPINANKLTITLGATNLAKLTDEEKQIAIDKGFTLA